MNVSLVNQPKSTMRETHVVRYLPPDISHHPRTGKVTKYTIYVLCGFLAHFWAYTLDLHATLYTQSHSHTRQSQRE